MPKGLIATAVLLAFASPARAQEETGPLDQLESDLREVAGRDDRAFDALSKVLAAEFLRLDQPDRALLALRRAAGRPGAGRDILDLHARVAVQQGRPVEAFDSLTRLLALDPRDPEIQARWRKALDEGEGLLDASRHLEPLVRSDPENPRWRAALARAYLRDGRLEDAERQLGEALRLRPDDAESLELRATVLARSGRDDEATLAFEKVVGAAPDRPRLQAAWTILLDLYERRGRLPEVRRALEAEAGASSDWRVHVRLAELLRRAGDEAGARRVSRDALAKVPEADSVYFRQQEINQLLRAGDPAAESELRRAIELEPANGILYQQLANFLSRSGRHADACAVLEQGIAATSDPTILPAMRDTLERIKKLETGGQ